MCENVAIEDVGSRSEARSLGNSRIIATMVTAGSCDRGCGELNEEDDFMNGIIR